MNIFELTIIYLALGAPFGVYYVTAHSADTATSAFWNAALNLFLWPAYVSLFVYARILGKLPRPETADNVLLDIEAAASRCLDANARRVFRDAVARYIGLSEAAELPVGTSAVEGLAEIGVFSRSAAPAAVLRRRNREKILEHRDRARTALLELIPDGTTAKLLEELALIINDHAFPIEQRLHSTEHANSSPDVAAARVSIAA